MTTSKSLAAVGILSLAICSFTSCSHDGKTAAPGVPSVSEAIDLDLPSGTLWAPWDVGATKIGGPGSYFAWGETEGDKKDDYGQPFFSGHNYKWFANYVNDFTTLTFDVMYGESYFSLLPEDDAATVNWGAKWQMPTLEQFTELLLFCDKEWKEENWDGNGSLAGYMLTSQKNGKTLFLPALGGCGGHNLYCFGTGCNYWMKDVHKEDIMKAASPGYRNGQWRIDYFGYRYYGFPVRAVVAE